LGESPRQVGRQILSGAFILAAVGIAAGIALSLLLAPHLQAFLTVGISASDPLTLTALAATLLLVAVGSALVPARRASRINPLAALRD